ncbi:MAG TPA: TIGR00300 family protein [Armatimonadota bacterium]|nr:TIGR00300 family protein [Armatimonadota bacterium]
MSGSMRFLMCRPDFFEVRYVINPWMEGNVHKVSRPRAIAQWEALRRLLSDRASNDLVAPGPDLPDMTFTANAGLIVDRTVILSRFFHPERRGEEALFARWFREQGFTVRELPEDLPFEGAGDALIDRAGGWLWAAYGFRSELDSHPYLAEWLDLETLSLRLVDRRFYHLDTCFSPLPDGYLLYYPPAFDAYSNHLIEARVPEERRLAINETDALHFACNAICVDRTLFMHAATRDLEDRLEGAGFQVIETPLSEFIKAGGSAKCLTLRLDEPVPVRAAAAASVESRVVRLEGHLLDSGMLSRALDHVVDSGGSFQVLQFQLGEQRQSASTAEIKISAPHPETLDHIVSHLIEIGAALPDAEQEDARFQPVIQAGVAPDDFYATTIYPTEARVGGQWIRVDGQRMDAAIAVHRSPSETTARCKLLRDLNVGDEVVTGVDGIRTVRRSDARENRPAGEFEFMGAGVSSERRVETAVEQIAWELRRIRDRGGRSIVVAGPVVIHTGGADRVARLIREGYVQALLGGNAIAVHDIEQALLGTSLGVDLQRGVPVPGGHRHHLRAINTIRRCGSIAQAVEQGILARGIFYECVKAGVPFSLAGSIRDDGPLPDTRMDLVAAQEEYARLIEDADLILMLSSMLHSIGVGNMTPAGVKLVCVDINPAVVTKLSDRGSIESTGIVTDVGLFLSLLVEQLERLDQPFGR